MNSTENLGRDAIEYLVDLGKSLNDKQNQPQVIEVKGQTYVVLNGTITRYTEMDDVVAPDTFEAFTLSGLIEFIKEDVNGFFKNPKERCIVRVVNPTLVEVATPCKGVANAMNKLAVCCYVPPKIRFDTFMDSEDFAIMIQTNFLEDDNQRVVLQIARNLVEDKSEATADDGISQRVTIKQGVQSVDSAVFKNPAYLRPLRTFTEVQQPCSPFVVRFKEGKRGAIFEADGGKWKTVAVQTIGAYLKQQLSGLNVVVIA